MQGHSPVQDGQSHHWNSRIERCAEKLEAKSCKMVKVEVLEPGPNFSPCALIPWHLSQTEVQHIVSDQVRFKIGGVNGEGQYLTNVLHVPLCPPFQ